MDKDEQDAICQAISQIVPILDVTRGHQKMRLVLDAEAGHDVRQLEATYKAGCQVHTPHSVFCDCGWFRQGYNLARLPEGWR